MLFFLPASFFIIYLFIAKGFGWLIMIYGMSAYLVNGYHNNSFAIQDKDFLAINPNYPFRQLKIINFDGIEHIVIERGQSKWKYLFLLFEDNYLLIKTKNETYKFYCSGLEMDGFDEGFTEKTIEDLDNDLKQNGVLTSLNIKEL